MDDLVDPAIERYAIEHTSTLADAVRKLRAETDATMPSPQMAGGVVESALLVALAVATRATRVLEIGTFTGVTALSVASRLPAGATIVTLEVDEEVAALARRHIEASPWADRVELVVGNALDTLPRLDGPFDLVFMDAWKTDYPAYFEAVLPKLADHGLIVADNVLYSGRVLDPDLDDRGGVTMRDFARAVLDDPRVDSALLTVGDGLLLIWKR
jgi:caffeoyl-CoA O-methyltransferase